MSLSYIVFEKAKNGDTAKQLLSNLLQFLSILILIFSSLDLYAQDLTEEEIKRFEQIRDSLIQEGYYQKITQPVTVELETTQSLIEFSSYQNKSLSVTTDNSRATDFSQDGTRFYVLGRTSMNVAEYQLLNPWEIESAIFVRALDISAEMGSETQSDPVPNGIYFRKDDGNKMWVFNRSEIWEYTLDTSWDISTAEPTGYQDFSHLIVRGHDIDFKPDGSVLYVDDRIFASVFQFNLANAWDVTSKSLDYVLDISGEQEAVRGIQLNQTGERMYLMDTERQEVLEYSISTPYDLRSASFIGAYNVSGQLHEPRGLTFTPDFSMFYVTEAFQNEVFHYHMTTVDSNKSDIFADITELEAVSDQNSNISVSIQNEHGIAIPNVEIELTADKESQIENIHPFTDENGEAIFRVQSMHPNTVTYSATAIRLSGNVELNQKLEISFFPHAPVVLNPTEVGTNEFAANWEMVAGATSYILDVSEDSEFESFVYQSEDVGFVTDFQVTGLKPGESYYYRVRAVSDSLISVNSETVNVVTYPKVPVVSGPVNVNATKFTAKWQPAEGARNYILDVAADEDFEDIVQGYENLNVSDQLSYNITDLYPGSEYYYRVRSSSLNRESLPSEPMNVSTIKVSTDKSNITSSQIRALANGEQEIIVEVMVIDDDGNPIQDEEIDLFSESGNSQIERVQPVTDENGYAIFGITSTLPEKENYTATIAETFEIGYLQLEFLPVEGELVLGNNYPNPFSRLTTIPVTVPDRMQVKIQLFNSLGARVRTIFYDELETGYHEIPIDLSGLAAGAYFYRLITDQDTQTKNMILVK